MARWKDVTNYPRGDRTGREATAFELEIAPRFRITVLRGHIHWPSEQWLLSCVALRYLDETPLDSTTADAAKREGFNRAWDYLGSMRDAMLGARPWLNASARTSHLFRRRRRYPLVIETFRDPDWSLQQLIQDKPSSINFLSYRRYRVTAELIDESKDVLIARLQEMWDHADGFRTATRIGDEAVRLGASLAGLPGSKRSVRHG